MILGVDNKPPLDELVHYGVKGMHWGVRKDDGASGTKKPSRFTPEQKTRAKQVAIGAGVLVAVAGSIYVAKQMNTSTMQVPVSRIKPPSSATKKVVDKVLQEQTDIIHASRGRNVGFRFLKSGGLKDALADYEKAFGANNGQSEVFERLSDGRIAAAFLDPHGRSDVAGRRIPHQVLIPRSMAGDVHNLDDVKTKIWPKLADAYDEVYKMPRSDKFS